MSALVRSESSAVLSAIESALGTQPTTGWRKHQPNPDGIQDFYPKIKKVRRNPLSPNRQNEKGDIVDLDAEPKLVCDLSKELLDHLGCGIVLAVEKWSGGTGTGRFAVTAGLVKGDVALSAVAAGAYTVASGGALQAGTLAFARGFTNAANNGLQVVAAASTATSIKVTAAVVEASPPAVATLEVAGFQGASADITATTTGLSSTVADFTTMGLFVGQWIWVGGGTLAAPGAFGFSGGGYRGWARITAIAAHALTLDRTTAAQVVDAGAGKTIQIFFGSFLRNVAIDNADYQETSFQLELSLPGAATAAATDYVYAQGCLVDTFEINMPRTDKAVATVTFNGTNITDPSTTRATGASTAPTPLATAAMNTVIELSRIRVMDPATGNSVSVDINSCKLMLQNNVTPQKQLATFGAARVIVGKCEVSLDLEVFLVQDDVIKAIRDNRTLQWEGCIRNNDGGIVMDIPSGTFEGGAEKFPANGPVTVTPTLMAFRDTTYNYTLGISRFPNLPAS